MGSPGYFGERKPGCSTPGKAFGNFFFMDFFISSAGSGDQAGAFASRRFHSSQLTMRNLNFQNPFHPVVQVGWRYFTCPVTLKLFHFLCAAPQPVGQVSWRSTQSRYPLENNVLTGQIPNIQDSILSIPTRSRTQPSQIISASSLNLRKTCHQPC